MALIPLYPDKAERIKRGDCNPISGKDMIYYDCSLCREGMLYIADDLTEVEHEDGRTMQLCSLHLAAYNKINDPVPRYKPSPKPSKRGRSIPDLDEKF